MFFRALSRLVYWCIVASKSLVELPVDWEKSKCQEGPLRAALSMSLQCPPLGPGASLPGLCDGQQHPPCFLPCSLGPLATPVQSPGLPWHYKAACPHFQIQSLHLELLCQKPRILQEEQHPHWSSPLTSAPYSTCTGGLSSNTKKTMLLLNQLNCFLVATAVHDYCTTALLPR